MSEPGDGEPIAVATAAALRRQDNKPEPITPMRLFDHDGNIWEFRPQQDITTYELALLINMSLKLLSNRGTGILDWKSHLEEHKLARHFRKL